MPVDKELLEILACPKCKQPVELKERLGAEYLVCAAPDCRLAYPVRDDIPVMLIDEAERWSDS
jgi:uncharacterized protein YbaR (Trm112 family)